MRFEIDWASPIVESNFTVFALFYFVFEGTFPSTNPRGLYLEGRFNGGFFALRVWGAYTWRGLFLEFYGISFATFSCTYFLLNIRVSFGCGCDAVRLCGSEHKNLVLFTTTSFPGDEAVFTTGQKNT